MIDCVPCTGGYVMVFQLGRGCVAGRRAVGGPRDGAVGGLNYSRLCCMCVFFLEDFIRSMLR